MPKFEHGLERGFGIVIEAIIVSAMFSGLAQAELVPKIYFTMFNVVSIIGLVFLIDKSRYWGFGYLAGFVIGIFFSLDALISTSYLGIADLILYGGVAVGSIGLRIHIHRDKF